MHPRVVFPRRWFHLHLLIVCLIVGPPNQMLGADRATSPNVVIILADDMGWGDVTCYNSASKCPTPHIDELAARGMRFTDAHSAGAWCTPARYGLLTGRYAFRTSLAWQTQPVIAEGTATIADVLRDAGYRTAAVGKWHLGFTGGPNYDFGEPLRGGPCDRGFDSFFGMRASLDIPDYYWIQNRTVEAPPTIPIADSVSPDWSPVQGRFWRGGLRAVDFDMEGALDRICQEAERRIDSFAGGRQPFFLYVPLTSPHTPWLPADKFQKQNRAGLYSQFVSHTDDVVGRLVTRLKENDLTRDTLVLFTSDNGPVWYQADIEKWGHDSMGGFRGMKGDVWEAGHRIPFIVSWPQLVPAGTKSDQLISFVDVLATVAELAHGSRPETAIDSLSFAQVWAGKTDAAVRKELVTFQQPIAFREGDWKLIKHPGSAGFLAHDRFGASPFLQRDELNPDAAEDSPASGQLYDLSADPGEQTNLWSQHPAIVQRLLDRLEQVVGSDPR